MVNFDTGGKTPNASAVRKIITLGCPPILGITAPGIYSRGYAALVFSVRLPSSKSGFNEFLSTTTFSSTAPDLRAFQICGSASSLRFIHFA